jgi:ABC-type transport system involved in cytochrome bd biosynthesis fused ATPase/permease subunit
VRIDTRLNYFLFGVFVAALILPFLDGIISLSLALLLFIYLTVVISLNYKKRREARKNRLQIKKNREHKLLQKITKKRHIEQEKKHETINNQVAHIQQMWELSQDQQKTFVRFIEKRAYSDLYTKMTASLLPQLIRMIEICLEQNKSGCKRQIQKRINELVKIMKAEISRTDAKKRDDFETTSEVYDQLLHEIKPKH